jgi:hypothetical protein
VEQRRIGTALELVHGTHQLLARKSHPTAVTGGMRAARATNVLLQTGLWGVDVKKAQNARQNQREPITHLPDQRSWAWHCVTRPDVCQHWLHRSDSA